MDEEEDCEPEDLIDKPFYFNVLIESAKIPENYENVFVEYSLRLNNNDNVTFKTEELKEQTRNPVFNYRKTHSYNKVNDEILNYLQTTNVSLWVMFSLCSECSELRCSKQTKSQKNRPQSSLVPTKPKQRCRTTRETNPNPPKFNPPS